MSAMDSGEWEDAESDMESVYRTNSIELKRRRGNTKEQNDLAKAFDIDIKYDPNMSMEEHHDKVIASFVSKLYQEKHLCDVVLKVGNHEFPAHKVVLAAHSPKLYKLFTKLHEGKNVELILNESTTDGVAATLCFIYTSKIVISLATVDDLLSASKQLGFQEIIQLCARFLLKDDTLTVFEQLDIAQRHHLDDVSNSLDQFINEHFLDIVSSAEHLKCSFSCLCEIASRDALHVISEIDVFYAILAWLDTNRKERMEFAADAMKCVRFILISPEDIATHVETTHVIKVPEINAMIYQALRYHALLNTGSSLASVVQVPGKRHWLPSSVENLQIRKKLLEKPKIKKRDTLRPKQEPSGYHDFPKPEEVKISPCPSPLPLPPLPDSVLLIGGVTSLKQELYPVHPWNTIMQYTLRDNFWEEGAKLPKSVHHHALARIDHFIYVIGGSAFDHKEPTALVNPIKDVQRYDVDTESWRKMSPLTHARMYVEAVVLDDTIYAIGGQDDDGGVLCNMERYNETADSWEVIPLPSCHIGIAVTVHRGQIFAAGGYCSDTRKALKVVGTYDVDKNSWSKKNDMIVGRCHARLVDVKGTMYVIGGATKWETRDAISSLGSISMYDDDADSWSRVAEMKLPRHDVMCAVVGSKIFIMGGISTQGNRCLTTVECFETETNSLRTDVEHLVKPNVGGAAVFVPSRS
ncbi:unnamed protein product [Owenia fusiformis]|uniref:Uncharacterized protein n=1 Tax=Owenia fusiformis TaxID=6347 RepID=A0A8J1TWE6_OWEFU|nr:unnamed protein product [Owenia fusiformis]